MNELRFRPWMFWVGILVTLLVFVVLVRSILLPFVLGTLIAYMLDPLADKFERTGMSRGSATSLVTVFFFTIITLVLVFITPVIAHQLSGLIISIPEYIASFDAQYRPRLQMFLGSLPDTQVDDIKAAASNVSGILLGMITNFITGLISSGAAFINILSLILITPVVAFYLLRDWDSLTTHIDGLLPRKHYETIRTQLRAIDDTLSGFLRGQINVCLIMAVYYAIGLSLAGLKFGIVIGIATGFLAIIPYVGLMVAMGTGMAVAFFQFDNFTDIGVVLGVFLVGQMLEGYYFTPKFVGEKVGLHPVWIIFGLLAGGALFGFTGVLIAVPVSAVVGVLIRFGITHYLQSPYYKGSRRAAAK
jgi:predicted PurR-regulated permease PerM